MTYIIGDLHFDHTNIINYCNRPYETVEEMNEALITNWNTAIDPDDDVLFLGDLTVKSGVSPIYSYVDQLNGNWIFVLGNHDTVAPPNIPDPDIVTHYQFTYRGIPFYAVHDPSDAPPNFRGWTLHGHHHNNHLDVFPFINPNKRRVNASVELIDYRPLHLDDLIPALQNMEWAETIYHTEIYIQVDD